MRLPAAAALAMGLAAAAGTPAQNTHSGTHPDPHAVVDAMRSTVEKTDFRVTGHLVRIDAGGSRTSYPLTIQAHWFPGELRVLVKVNAPSGAKKANQAAPVHFLLELKPNASATIRVAHPGEAAAANLPLEQWTDGVAGTGFAYEDFFEQQYFWTGQTVAEQTKYGARACNVLVSIPGATDKTHYAQVKSWLDQTINFPVYVEKTMKGPSPLKQYTFFGLRQDGGIWSANQIEEKNRGQQGSSLLIIDRGTPKAHLGLADFGPEQLARFP
jgi:hypothetical protein